VNPFVHLYPTPLSGMKRYWIGTEFTTPGDRISYRHLIFLPTSLLHLILGSLHITRLEKQRCHVSPTWPQQFLYRLNLFFTEGEISALWHEGVCYIKRRLVVWDFTLCIILHRVTKVLMSFHPQKTLRKSYETSVLSIISQKMEIIFTALRTSYLACMRDLRSYTLLLKC